MSTFLGEDHDIKGSILGSQAIFGSVDTAIYLGEKGGQRSIQTDQRFGESIPETNIYFDQETKEFTQGQRTKEKSEEELSLKIVDFLRSKPSSFDKILAGVGGKKKLLSDTLRSLVDRGRLSCLGKGRRGSPQIFTLIADSGPSYIEESRVRNNEEASNG